MENTISLESLAFIKTPYKYSVKKNLFSKSYSADFSFTSPIKEPTTFLTDWFIPAVKELLSVPLINIKGDSRSERLFFLSGVSKSEDPNSNVAGLDFSIEVKTVYAGRHSKGKYLNKTTYKSSGAIAASTSIDFDQLINVIKNCDRIDRCELNLEFMTEHFLTSLGLAPVIEESVAVHFDGEKSQLFVTTHSQSLEHTINGPLNNIDWGHKIIELAKIVENA